MTLRVEPLSPADVSASLDLSLQAGWDVREADWRRMVAADWIDSLGGWADDELAATASVVRYGDALAWIGSIIVEESRRRRGLGTDIFGAALERARDCRVVGLDANDGGKPIYEAAGFVGVAPAEQWAGVLDPRGDASAVSRDADAALAAPIDRAACEVDRTPLLRSFLADPDATAYRIGTEAYAVTSPTRAAPVVGPMVAPSADHVSDLLAAIATDLGGSPVTVNVVPGGDPTPFRDAGLTHRRTLTRMVDSGDARPLMGSSIRAVAGFAYG